MRQKQTIPFFVVDRPMSLKLLESCGIKSLSFKVGLMSNANTTKEFQEKFRKFRAKNVIKMVDSGVFTKHGTKSPNYRHLFDTYVNMGAKYGIVIDVIKDKNATLRKAEEAMKAYKKGGYKRKFKLVGVAQGKSIDDYVKCYKKLKKLGFKHIAIGGLLKKKENTARFVNVRDEDFIEKVVGAIRKDHPHDWLFLLGTYHPKRHHRLNKMKIFGADFKGWILNYQPPETYRDEIEERLKELEKEFPEPDIRERIRRAKVSLIQLRKGSDEQRIRSAEKRLTRLRLSFGKMLMRRNKHRGKAQLYVELIEEQVALRKSRDELRDRRFSQVRNYLHKYVFGKMKSRKLVIVSCSNKKRPYPWPEKAIKVYDGPFFRILRNSDAIYNGVDLKIISGKFGMIQPNKPIRPYDYWINPKDVNRLNKQVIGHLQETFKSARYNEIYVCMGKNYLATLEGIESIKPKECKVIKVEGRIGQKLQQMKRWLDERD